MARRAKSLLMIEDNDVDVEVVQRLMRKLSLELRFVWARNGEEALEILLEGRTEETLVPPYVILLDINMPRMNGFELLDRLAGEERIAGVPIFIVSTSSSPRDRAEAMKRDVRGYVIKPLDREALLSVLEAV